MIYIYNEGLYYSFINPNEIIINGCVDDTKSIYNIPGYIDGIPVVGIASGAFCNLNNLIAVDFWPGNMFIEENAFVNCPSLRCVMVCDIKSIGVGNFDGCPKLIIGTDLYMNAAANCMSMLTRAKIGDLIFAQNPITIFTAKQIPLSLMTLKLNLFLAVMYGRDRGKHYGKAQN